MTQPASIAVPVGRTATFTVAANGTAPISYQWSKNGEDISGATSDTYTTPVVAEADSGAVFKVKVSNSAGSATSDAATLTAGPRAPAMGDLRYLLFEQVNDPGLGGSGAAHINILANTQMSFDNTVGTPLQLGSRDSCAAGVQYDCTWFFSEYPLPSTVKGLNVGYRSSVYENFSNDLARISGPNVVVTSLDFEPGNDLYAVSWVSTAQGGGFQGRMDTLPRTDVDAVVADYASRGKIVTAASFDASGEAVLISYGWSSDTTTVYESQTAIVTPDKIAETAQAWGAQGYVISAFGGNDDVGYLLVGIRVKGDTMPRPTRITSPLGNVTAANANSAYFTTVVSMLADGLGQIEVDQQ